MSDSKRQEIMERLIEIAARTTQEIGLGRIVGQVMGYVYFREEETCLDDMVRELGLSKAAVSIAARQLEGLRLLQRVWKKGDRRHYYRLAPHFGVALQQGLLETMRGKLQTIGAELDDAEALLGKNDKADNRTAFMRQRLARAARLRKRASQVLGSPLVKLIGKL